MGRYPVPIKMIIDGHAKLCPLYLEKDNGPICTIRPGFN